MVNDNHGGIVNLVNLTDPAPLCGTFVTGCAQGGPLFGNFTRRNFEPRLGFAWDPFHNGKTSVRGGFGIFDALPLPYELVINNAQTSPFHVTSTLHNPGEGLFPKKLVFATDSPAAQTWNYVQPDPGRNYIYQWNLNVQRQITANTSITVAYVGSRAYHNPFQLDDINTVFPFNTSAGWLFPNPVASGCIPPAACGVVSSTTNGLSSAVSGLGATVNGLGAAAVNGLGQTVGSALTSLAGPPATAATTTTLPPLPSIVAPLTKTVTSTVQDLLGQG